MLNNYELIGPLTKDEFIAIKTVLGFKVAKVDSFSLDNIKKENNGNFESVALNNLKPGDNIKIKVALTTDGGQVRTGFIAFNNLSSIDYDKKTEQLLLESDQSILTNIDYTESLQIINTLISNPDIWITEQNMLSLGLKNATYMDVDELISRHEEVNKKQEPLSVADIFANGSIHDILSQI